MPHIHEKIDFTVEVFIVHKNKVLLRKHDKYKIWLSVGGHIELDEDPTEAAVREVKEEVGLDIDLLDDLKPDIQDPETRQLIPPKFVCRHWVNTHHEHVIFVYFATSDSDNVQVGTDGDRSDDWKWVTKKELETMDLRPNVKFYAHQALTELAQ